MANPRFTSRLASLEAVPLELSGQRLYAIAIDGKAHLVDAVVFEVLFVSAPVEDPEELIRLEVAPPRTAPMVTRAVKPIGSQPRVSEVAQRCLDILREHGPLTSAELRGHVYRDLDARKALQNFSALSLDMRRRGLIEKRTDPRTQLDQWHVLANSEVLHG